MLHSDRTDRTDLTDLTDLTDPTHLPFPSLPPFPPFLPFLSFLSFLPFLTFPTPCRCRFPPSTALLFAYNPPLTSPTAGSLLRERSMKHHAARLVPAIA